jgi:hypothetical protein
MITERDIRLYAYESTSILEYGDNPGKWELRAEDKLTDRIAFLLQRDKAETIKTEDRYEKRVDLYVATPDVFWKIINEEAERIAMRFIGRKKSSECK